MIDKSGEKYMGLSLVTLKRINERIFKWGKKF